jgi:hypothetical protein
VTHTKSEATRWPTARTARWFSIPTTACLALGCASMFLSGGQIVDHDLSSRAEASYRTTTCVQLANNSQFAGPPGVTWHLIREGNVYKLFERESTGRGTLIENRWTAADGEHFFVRVQSNGWEYVIARPPTAVAQRLVYVGVSTTKSGSIERPVGAPAVRCDLASTGVVTAATHAATPANAAGTPVNGLAATAPAPAAVTQPMAPQPMAPQPMAPQPMAPQPTTAVARPQPTAVAASAADAGSGDPQARRQIAKIMSSDFNDQEYANAERGLMDTLIGCGNACSPAVNATIWMQLGVVRGVGLHNQKKALEAFRTGLKQDPQAEPQTSQLDAPTFATYQKARKELSKP